MLRKRLRDNRAVPLRAFERQGTARNVWQWLHGAAGRAWLVSCAHEVQDAERARFPRLRQYSAQPWAQWRDGRAVFVVNSTFVAFFRSYAERGDCIARTRTTWQEPRLEVRWRVGDNNYKNHVIIVEL